MSGLWPLSKEGNQYLCVLQDYFSKWIEVYEMPDKKALSVAKCPVKFMARYGRLDKRSRRVCRNICMSSGVCIRRLQRRTRHGPMDWWSRKQDYPAVAESIL